MRILVSFLAASTLAFAYSTGPNTGYTAAPGDNETACIASGCHVGTPNSGPGGVKIVLPQGNSGTYVPGSMMQILIAISDSTKVSAGFEMTARSGSDGLTQAGDFSNVDPSRLTSTTQIKCESGLLKTSTGCGSFPIQYIEHTYNGYTASIASTPKGSYTYAVNWTPPAATSGPVTFYVAANCGTGTDKPSGTNVYTANITLVPASSGPLITGVNDAESARASITSGQWVAIYGTSLSATSRTWTGADFTGGTALGAPLPTKLDGVSVTIGGQPAPVYYVSPTQLDVQAPSGLTQGANPVVVTNNGSVTAAFNVNVVQSSPSFFYYSIGPNLYPLAVHLNDGKIVGDPVLDNTKERAHPGEILELYVNGLGPSQGGSIVGYSAFTGNVSVTASGSGVTTTLPVVNAGLAGAGEFLVNVIVPSTLTSGTYTLNISAPGGSTADSGVTIQLPVGS